MSYASLMVHVDADGELAGRVGIAAGLADLFDAHLIGVAGWAPMSVFSQTRHYNLLHRRAIAGHEEPARAEGKGVCARLRAADARNGDRS
jgi:hypothetical protein